ncbi:hypothetical protein JZ751_030053 [Albula glossodonta]|uniref:Uncharacterized protein n=1 Tax=Albula glossodonta TaxID=121402 RepID=A0A8T2MQ13_9TELE|nr:hypothetical protein JZ751_030053 [Albula glossodonta]
MFNSQKTEARHYRTLQEMYKTKKPNKATVTHLLDLGFESRRHFIASDAVKEQDRLTKILEAYPCFQEVDHAMDELRRIIQPTNIQYICEMKDKWKTFYSQVQFYGVMKKAMNPPRTLNGVTAETGGNAVDHTGQASTDLRSVPYHSSITAQTGASVAAPQVHGCSVAGNMTVNVNIQPDNKATTEAVQDQKSTARKVRVTSTQIQQIANRHRRKSDAAQSSKEFTLVFSYILIFCKTENKIKGCTNQSTLFLKT